MGILSAVRAVPSTKYERAVLRDADPLARLETLFRIEVDARDLRRLSEGLENVRNLKMQRTCGSAEILKALATGESSMTSPPKSVRAGTADSNASGASEDTHVMLLRVSWNPP